jgi:hypothetical protein
MKANQGHFGRFGRHPSEAGSTGSVTFIDALRWLRDADTVLTELVVNPSRPDRLEPRVLKRGKKELHPHDKTPNQFRKALRRKKPAA